MNPQHYPQFIHKMWIMLRKLVLNIQNNVDKKKIVEVLKDADKDGDGVGDYGSNGVYKMKEGDIFSVSVKNTNKTLSQTIRGVFYSISGSDVYSIAAQHSGVVTATGSY